jgi:hypothetical protein
MFRRYLVLLITYGPSFSNISESENYHFQLFFGAGREENKKQNKTRQKCIKELLAPVISNQSMHQWFS